MLDGAERGLSPGLWTVDLTGHTPGHMDVRIADQDQSLLLVADMLFHPAVRPARADIGSLVEAELDTWLHHYNHDRPHPGYRNQGRRAWESVQRFVTQEG